VAADYEVVGQDEKLHQVCHEAGRRVEDWMVGTLADDVALALALADIDTHHLDDY